MIELTPEELGWVAIALGLVASGLAAIALVQVWRWRRIYEQALDDNVRAKLAKPDAKLVGRWKVAMASATEHSPQWKAYKRRLAEIGVLDGD